MNAANELTILKQANEYLDSTGLKAFIEDGKCYIESEHKKVRIGEIDNLINICMLIKDVREEAYSAGCETAIKFCV